jgi:hypothetical protein
MNNKTKPDAFEPSKSRAGPAGKTFLSSTMNRRSNKKPKGKSNNCYKESTINRDMEVIIITLKEQSLKCNNSKAESKSPRAGN